MKKRVLALLIVGIVSNINADAFQNAEKACNEGKGRECLFVGSWYMSGKHVKQDSVKAAEFFSKACEFGAAIGCYNLGNMYARGEGVKHLPGKAKQLFKKACEGGIENACYNYKIVNQ
ncbi:tetratricopeptide repeat protein [Sulfurovum riftiae]|uniref:tetratricopeptide repeat protein n=1 Tax=Sulfurovum riftiae TaxID=1630136 RepID=UPI00137A7CD8|nr:tetratricopeptide repeat protein [Sulfurovum riftiae]